MPPKRATTHNIVSQSGIRRNRNRRARSDKVQRISGLNAGAVVGDMDPPGEDVFSLDLWLLVLAVEPFDVSPREEWKWSLSATFTRPKQPTRISVMGAMMSIQRSSLESGNLDFVSRESPYPFSELFQTKLLRLLLLAVAFPRSLERRVPRFHIDRPSLGISSVLSRIDALASSLKRLTRPKLKARRRRGRTSTAEMENMYCDTKPKSSFPSSVLGNWAMSRAKKAAMKESGS